jgi:hypothetical protein
VDVFLDFSSLALGKIHKRKQEMKQTLENIPKNDHNADLDI